MKKITALELKQLVARNIADVRMDLYPNQYRNKDTAPTHSGNIRLRFMDSDGNLEELKLPMSSWNTSKPGKWENGLSKPEVSARINRRKIDDMRKQREALAGEALCDNPNLIDERKESSRAEAEFANRDAVHDAATARRLPATDEPDSDEVKPKRQRRKRTAA